MVIVNKAVDKVNNGQDTNVYARLDLKELLLMYALQCVHKANKEKVTHASVFPATKETLKEYALQQTALLPINTTMEYATVLVDTWM